ncbi:MAG TPA: filamentous hemagglutinin N-terminal domain-containing protein [Coleofasciculaceae cyanobacterium]|jgi:filamentous hemagglutinin family protein
MSLGWRHHGWLLEIALARGVLSIVLGMSGAIACTCTRAFAQIVPDATLPINSVVTTNGGIQTITGGTQAGTNLFHSFNQFSVVTGSTAYFNNPLTVQNIINRVTGSSISDIDGLIQANGAANLFLINPNGIIFGPNATLNIGGSFVGSTASSIQFADSTQFSARNPAATPLLTISVPIGLQFNGNEGNIVLRAGNPSSNAFTETGDAGQLINTAQVVNGQPPAASVRTISGTLSDVNDVDLYQIYLDRNTAFSASTVDGTAVDTQLFLFDARGLGIYTNDDRNGTVQSIIPPSGQPFSLTSSGIYYLGISSYNNQPYSAFGNIFGSDYATGPGAAAPLTGWDNQGIERGAYTITLYGAEFVTPGRFQVQPGKTLALVGGQVSVEGTKLRVPGSRVELGGLAAPGTVGLNIDPGTSNLTSLRFPNGVARADVSIASTPTSDTLIDVAAGGGGSIAINARNIDISAAFFRDPNNFYKGTSTTINAGIAPGQGFPGAQAGDITFNATGTVTTSLFTFILNDVVTGAVGNGGNVIIKAGTLSLNSSQFGTSTFGQGNAGNVLLDINDSAFISTTIFSNVFFPGVGDSGSITVKAGSLVLDDAILSTGTRAQADVPGNAGNILLDVRGPISLRDSRLYSNVNPDAFGNGGNITIRAGSLSLSEESGFATQTEGRGNAGSITIEALGGAVSIDQGVILSRVLPGAVGNGGDISIEARSLTLTGGAGLFTNTSSAGNAGNIQIKVTDSVSISGTGSFSPGSFGDFDGPSGLVTRTESANRGGDILITTNALHVTDTGILDARTIANGDAGNIDVTANTVTVQNEAQVSVATLSTAPNAGRGGALTIKTGQLLVQNGNLSTETQGAGLGGTLTVNARDSVQLRGEGGLFAQATDGGTAGNLTLTTGQLTVQDGAKVTVSSPQGQAGNLTVTANSMLLDRGSITAVTGKGQGEGGANITLKVPDVLLMRNESLISADALGTANGGNINIDAGFLVALPPEGLRGSDVAANAVQGNGGRVNLTVQGIYGTEFRPKQTPLNDITASSEFGVAGVVAINRLDVDPSQGLTSLPTDLVDPTGLIDRRCQAVRGPETSQFTITGRGGLPPNPNEILGEEGLLEDLGTPVRVTDGARGGQQPTTLASSGTSSNRLVEAQGWIVGSDGTVILTAQASSAVPQHPWQTPVSCQAVSNTETFTVSPR